MNRYLLLSLTFAAAAVSSMADVTQSSAGYSCCKPQLQLAAGCEVLWSVHNKPFAHRTDSRSVCWPPCSAMDAGSMTLGECVSVNATVVCTDDRAVTREERISFSGQPCSGSGPPPGSPGCFWLVVGLLEKLMACRR